MTVAVHSVKYSAASELEQVRDRAWAAPKTMLITEQAPRGAKLFTITSAHKFRCVLRRW